MAGDFSVHHRDQADAAIEGAQHFALARCRPSCASQPNTGARRPAIQIHFRVQPFGQGARQIFGDAAAGDMGQALDAAGLDRFQRAFHIKPRRRQQRFAQFLAGANGAGASQARPLFSTTLRTSE